MKTKLLLKALLLIIGLTSGLSANQTINNNNSIAAKSWRSGFITAYKAMEVETKLQGLGNKEVVTKKYIIYFDANGDDVSNWDSLMVQMFGYSSSIYKPVRTTSNWLIFGSYNNRATAYQELEMLNNKIFKNNKKYKLKIFINKNKKQFFTDSAILTSEIKGLKELLKKRNDEILATEKKNLEIKLRENQKVAIVYLDKKGHLVKPAKKSSNLKKNNIKVKNEKLLHSKDDRKGVIYHIKRKNSKLYLKPKLDKKYFFKNLSLGDRIRILSINGKWGLTSKKHYILMKYFYNSITKKSKKKQKKVNTSIKNQSFSSFKEPNGKNSSEKNISKPTSNNKNFMAPEEPMIGYIDTGLFHIDLYKIKGETFFYKKMIYTDFIKYSTMKNNFSDLIRCSYKVTDKSGNIYYKLYKKNEFIKLSQNVHFNAK